MIARIIDSGAGVRGMVNYITHDQGSKDNPRPQTADRVRWTACLGLAVDDPQLMRRVMQGLTADAEDLKRRAGVKAGGRPLRKPYTHLSLAWAPGQQPTEAEMREAATGALEAIGIDSRHYGVVAAHDDTSHPHVHIVVSRLDPETGRAATIGPPAARALSRWAEEYERAHGGIVVPGRVERRRAREQKRELTREQRKQGVHPAQARQRSRQATPQPPMRSGRTHAGRAAHNLDDQARAQVRRLYRQQQADQDVQRKAVETRIEQRRQEWTKWRAACRRAGAAGEPKPPRPMSPSVARIRAEAASERRAMRHRHRNERVSLMRRLTAAARRALDAVRRRVRNLFAGQPAPRPADPDAPPRAPDPRTVRKQIAADLDARLQDRAARTLGRLERTAARAAQEHERAERLAASARTRHEKVRQQTCLASSIASYEETRPPIVEDTGKVPPRPETHDELERRIGTAVQAARDAESNEARHLLIVEQAVARARETKERATRVRQRTDRRRARYEHALDTRQSQYQRLAPSPPAGPTPTSKQQPAASMPAPTPDRRYQDLDVRPAREIEMPGMSLDTAVRIADERNRAQGFTPPEPERYAHSPSMGQPTNPPPGRGSEPERRRPPAHRTPPLRRETPLVAPAAPRPRRPPSIPDGQDPEHPHRPRKDTARPRPQLVEVLIGAVCAGGTRLARVRSEFERMDAGDGRLNRLVQQAVDPELLEAVVGPRLAPMWVEPLRAQYSRFKQAYPRDWVDVEKFWRKQRARWRTVPQERVAQTVNPPTPPAPATGAADRAQRKRQPGPHHGM